MGGAGGVRFEVNIEIGRADLCLVISEELKSAVCVVRERSSSVKHQIATRYRTSLV